jgi:hypothetical protein
MLTKTLIAAGLLIASLTSSWGADELFHANEFQLDIYGQFDFGSVDSHGVTLTTKHTDTNHVFVLDLRTRHVKIVFDEEGFITKLRKTRRVHFKGVSNNENGNQTAAGLLGGAWGGGVDLTYFFTRYLGMSLEGSLVDGDSAIHSVGGSLLLRVPIEFHNHTMGFAPYCFVGVGGQFDGTNAATGHVGGGIEFRFNARVAIFADGRYVADVTDLHYGLCRSGMRFVF